MRRPRAGRLHGVAGAAGTGDRVRRIDAAQRRRLDSRRRTRCSTRRSVTARHSSCRRCATVAGTSAITIPVTSDGVMPFSRYVIRKKGVVEVGSGSCLMCHARVMPDGTLLKGAQGNFPATASLADNLRQQAAASQDPAALIEGVRLGQRTFFSMPWLTPDPIAAVASMSIDEIARVYEAVPVGASTRVNLSLFTPAQIPDLIGVRDRHFLDHTGLVQQRSIADLMRYVAIVQGANAFDRFGDFRLVDPVPDPAKMDRYSDEQLYALAKISVLVEAAGESASRDRRDRTGPPGLRARRVHRVPHRAALHQQHADARGRLQRSRCAPAALRDHRSIGGHRPGAGAADAQRHGLLQGAVAERRVVSRTVPARRRSEDAGRVVRSVAAGPRRRAPLRSHVERGRSRAR